MYVCMYVCICVCMNICIHKSVYVYSFIGLVQFAHEMCKKISEAPGPQGHYRVPPLQII